MMRIIYALYINCIVTLQYILQISNSVAYFIENHSKMAAFNINLKTTRIVTLYDNRIDRKPQNRGIFYVIHIVKPLGKHTVYLKKKCCFYGL